MNHRLKRFAVIAAFVLAASLIAALLVSSIFQRAVAEPIVHLAEIVRIVSRDKNYCLRATPTGNRDEPDILIHAFNDMLGQIQQRDEALRDAHRELEDTG
jgi:two-component system, sensor histidine kinase and response regulator